MSAAETTPQGKGELVGDKHSVQVRLEGLNLRFNDFIVMHE